MRTASGGVRAGLPHRFFPMSIENPSRFVALTRIYALFPTLNGIFAATAEQSIQGLNLALEPASPDRVNEHEAASIEARLRANAVRQQVGAFLYISVEAEFAYLSGQSPLRMTLGTRTGDDKNLHYVADAVIRQLQANGIAASWDASNRSLVLAS